MSFPDTNKFCLYIYHLHGLINSPIKVSDPNWSTVCISGHSRNTRRFLGSEHCVKLETAAISVANILQPMTPTYTNIPIRAAKVAQR